MGISSSAAIEATTIAAHITESVAEQIILEILETGSSSYYEQLLNG